MKDKQFVINKENVSKYIEKVILWIKNRVEESKCKGVVLGMSGGVDCSVVAKLCQTANIETHLILMPYGLDMQNSNNKSNAMELIDKFNFKYEIFDIKPAVDSLTINSNAVNIDLARANIRPRIRMTYLYEYAQINNLLVIGTGNLSERMIGYFTKWGDGAYDLNPIGMLTKQEVYVLAKYLDIPKSIINKKPSAGLWEGQTDEEELGMTYNQIDKYILNGTSGDKEIDEKIKRKYETTKHKRNSNGTEIFGTM